MEPRLGPVGAATSDSDKCVNRACPSHAAKEKEGLTSRAHKLVTPDTEVERAGCESEWLVGPTCRRAWLARSSWDKRTEVRWADELVAAQVVWFSLFFYFYFPFEAFNPKFKSPF